MADNIYPIQPLQQHRQSDDDVDPTKELEYTPNFGTIFTSSVGSRTTSSIASGDTSTSRHAIQAQLSSPLINPQTNQGQASMSLEPRQQRFQYQMPAPRPLATNPQQQNSFHNSPNPMLNQLLSTNVGQQQQHQPIASYDNCSYITGGQQAFQPQSNATNFQLGSSILQPTSTYIQSRPQVSQQYSIVPNVRQTNRQRYQQYIPPPSTYMIIRNPRQRLRAANRNYSRQPSPIPIIPNNNQPMNKTAIDHTVSSNTADAINGNTINTATPCFSHYSMASSVPSPNPHVTSVALNTFQQATSSPPPIQQSPRPQQVPLRQQFQSQTTLLPPLQHARASASPRANNQFAPRLLTTSTATNALLTPPLSVVAPQQVSPSQQQPIQTTLPQQTPVSVSSTTRTSVASLQNIDGIKKIATENKACQARILTYDRVSVGVTVAPVMVDQECQTDFDDRQKPEVKKYVDRACSPLPFASQVRFKITPKRRKVSQPSPKSDHSDSNDEINVIE